MLPGFSFLFLFFPRKSGRLDVLTGFPGNLWVCFCFFSSNNVQVHMLLCVSALFSAFFWETDKLGTFDLV